MSVAASLLQTLLKQQERYVNYFFNHLDLDDVEKILQICLDCKGSIVLTGIGKSGIIAEKIAATLTSTGTRALYLSAANLLHGDMGGVGEGDVVLLFSKSGQTEELLKLVPHIRNKKSSIVGIVSDRKSDLARLVDNVLYLPVEKELCPFDLVPTTSTVVQLLFGDLLTIALMQEKGFSIEEYASNHPSGLIGKKISSTVRDLMKVDESLPFCDPKDRLIDVIVELSNKRCGCLLVVSKEKVLLGIFTDGDLRRSLQEKGTHVMEKKMEELMNQRPIVVSPDVLAHNAMQTMQSKQYVMTAPVIEGGKVVGLIRMHDIIHEEY